MQTTAAEFSVILRGRECRVNRRQADWNFNFGERLNINANVPWRVVAAGSIAHGGEDDGQLFGLSEPVNGEARTNELLRGLKVSAVEIDIQTADLQVIFESETRLDFFNNSSAYEGWTATLLQGGEVFEIVALGGGRLAII